MTAVFTTAVFWLEAGMLPQESSLGMLWQRAFPHGAHHSGQPGRALWTHSAFTAVAVSP